MTASERASFHDHFSSVSKQYARYRPAYPADLFDWLASVAPGRNLAWDCATGTGHAAIGLASRFKQVIATDASPEQIAAAIPHPGITYSAAPSEKSGLDDGSVDLITVAQALHWFDIEHFFSEAERILVPGGVLAVWTYGPLSIEDEQINALVRKFASMTLAEWWPEEWNRTAAGRKTIPLPFEKLEVPELAMTADWTLGELVGHMRTWSAVTRYIGKNGIDPVSPTAEELSELWREREEKRRIIWPFMLSASKKNGRFSDDR